jgi:hypothetical protein
MSYTKDIEFGKEKEENIFARLKETIDKDLLHTSSRYNPFDFESENTYVELKSRRIAKDKFNSTMIGANKIELAEKTEKDVFFVFSYTDGDYYWKYNKDAVVDKKITFKIGGRYDRGKAEEKLYAYINTSLLTAF